ncbi:MAG: glycoside hydrolase family 15 protein [Planctomycetota bacterium]
MHNARLAALMRERWTAEDLLAVERLLGSWGALELPGLGNGLYSAIARPVQAGPVLAAPTALPTSPDVSGYASTWVRDTVQVAHSAWERGDVGAAQQTARALLAWFALQGPRFEDGLAGRADLSDPMQRPHIRFDGRHLREIAGWWPHAQNDALGYALWFLCRAALAGLLPLDAGTATVLWRFPRYFAALRYWEDRDSGHWEEARKCSASSVGTVLAGLVALRGLSRAKPELVGAGAPAGERPPDLAALIEAGRATLDALLPWESKQPGLERRADAALLFLIHPLRVVRGEQVAAILEQTRRELEGPCGIRRYVGDSYWMADYKRLFDEETRTSGFEDDVGSRDRHLKPGTEAQWCLFDPLLSALHGWRYIATRDPQEFLLQRRHFERSLGQITGADCPWGEGLCPEAYFLEDSRGLPPENPLGLAGRAERWVANDNTPLLWTQALLGGALRAMQNSVGLPA